MIKQKTATFISFRMGPLLVALLKKILIITSLFFLSNLYPAKSSIDVEDREIVELFLKHILIEDTGIYTLVGSKPITSFKSVPIFGVEEKKQLYLMQSENLRKYLSFEKYQPSKEDALKLWGKWKEVQGKYIGPQFMIKEDPSFGGGFFINVLTTTYIVNKHYEEFKKVLGSDFEPEFLVSQIGDGKDPAWKKIKRSHYLLGLLFGFGEKNANYFEWEQQKKILYPQRKSTSFFPAGSGIPARELTIQDLDIPSYISYQIIDEQADIYRSERNRCIELFEGKDFCDLAVAILSGHPPKPPKKTYSMQAQKLMLENLGYNCN